MCLCVCVCAVVANGGETVLERNEIYGANGDGVSLWNDACARLAGNFIHANLQAAIGDNTDGQKVTLSENRLRDNREGGYRWGRQASLEGTTTD